MKRLFGTIKDFTKVMFIETRHVISEDLKHIASRIEPTSEQLEWSKEIRSNWKNRKNIDVEVVTE